MQLRQADFTTAARITTAINKKFAGGGAAVARAENSALVAIETPAAYGERTTEFVAELESLTVEADRPAKVVINERTGTIAMGKEVRISPVAVMHGNLSVEIQTAFQVSQPAPFTERNHGGGAAGGRGGQAGEGADHHAEGGRDG